MSHCFQTSALAIEREREEEVKEEKGEEKEGGTKKGVEGREMMSQRKMRNEIFAEREKK